MLYLILLAYINSKLVKYSPSYVKWLVTLLPNKKLNKN